MLSFLNATEEEDLRDRFPGMLIISGRAAGVGVRAAARERYIDLVARMGTVPVEPGLTLRSALVRGRPTSSWWYHPVAFKDCESDSTYASMLAIEMICVTAKEHGVTKLILVGAPAEVAAVLGSAFDVAQQARRRSRSLAPALIRGVLSRMRMLIRLLRYRTVTRPFLDRTRPTDVALAAYWDWSLRWDNHSGDFEDRYFKDLPKVLRARDLRVQWFTWLEPDSEPRERERSLDAVLAPIRTSSEVVFLNALISPSEIALAYLRFDTWRTIRKAHALRKLLRDERIDYFPLFKRPLLIGAVGSTIGTCELLALAYQRAAALYQPHIVLSFLEHFPHSRALYAGISASNRKAWLIQHASYSHDKTFLALDREREYRGWPDGCQSPHADRVFSMGMLGKRLFEEMGYPEASVVATGSTRYDIRFPAAAVRRRLEEKPFRILVVSSMDVETDIEMVQAAVAAVNGLNDVVLTLRSHPFRKVEEHPAFASLQGRVAISVRSLDDDLADTDVVLFTYSTVAEEALLRGVRVWQWLPRGYNASALAEVAAIRSFTTIRTLRNAIEQKDRGYEPSEPSEAERRRVADELFGAADGSATARIADFIEKAIRNEDHRVCAIERT